jgi:hypothetical protein
VTATRRREPRPVDWLNAVERAQLRRRVYQLFELRDTPYLRDGIEDLIEWWYSTEPDRLERAARYAERARPLPYDMREGR